MRISQNHHLTLLGAAASVATVLHHNCYHCHAQQILNNAIVYTVDENNPIAEAIAIDENGFIVGVGTADNVTAEFPTYSITDLNGQLVLPGFQDAHLHAVEAGINGQICYVSSEDGIENIPFYFDEADCANGGAFGGQGWIMGAGVDLDAIVAELAANESARYPIEVLDEIFPDIPVVILDQFGHGALANTAGMEAVGYTTAQDPPGGQILRDDDGEPIGIVTENAQQKLREAAFPPTEENQDLAYRSLKDALEVLKKNGITTVSDAGGFWRQAQTESWSRAEEEGILTVRASNALYVYPDENIASQLSELTERYSNDPDALVRFNQAKIYVDGILSLSTGKLFDPYEYDPFAEFRNGDSETWNGFEYFGTNTTLNFISQALANAGFQLHYHVTGDYGANLALSAIESTQSRANIEPYRLTHCYLVDELDRPRFEELGVIADFQLAPSSVSAEYTEGMAEFIGTERAATLLPAVELYEAGAMLTLSSDWDADTLSPLKKMETALNRPTGRSFTNLTAIIPMLTLNVATLLQHDHKTGSIEVGKLADLVVIDKDIFSLPTDQISTAEVTRTYLQGELVFGGRGGTGATGAVDGVGERGDGVSPSGGDGTEAPVDAPAPTPIPSSGVDGKGSRSLSALSLLAASSYLLSL